MTTLKKTSMLQSNGASRRFAFANPQPLLSGLSRAMAALLSFLLAFEPALVQAQSVPAVVQADPSAAAANQPKVGAASNGVPLVDIVAPNGAGLSHNKYSDFNVGTPGLILNNSNQDLARSELGGLVPGNANLRGSGPARVILNEVTGARRSLLEGATEVNGTAADVVIANPNGLTCNGCGFINTPRATLSTGKPELGPDGALSGLKVEGGDVAIGANGGDFSRSTLFDIVSRTITVDGPVKAGGDLNLIAGRNSYAYASGLVTPLASDGNEPALAIDSSALGGMYAGRIKLIATEQGSGVNMQGDMAANAGAMTLSADGKLTLGKAYAKGPATVRSTGNAVKVETTLFSEDAVVLEGRTAVEVADAAVVAAKGDASLSASEVTLGAGALAASGMDAGGTLGTSGTLSVTADRLTAGSGRLAAGGLLSISAGLVDLDRADDTGGDSLRSRGAITIESGTVKAANGQVSAAGNIQLLFSGDLQITGGRFAAGGDLLARAARLSADASLSAVANARLETTAGTLAFSGAAQSNGSTTVLSAGDLDNSGRILSLDHVSVTAMGTLTNAASGTIAGGNGVELTAGQLANAGAIAAEGGVLKVKVGGVANNDGSISGLATLTLSAGSLTNSGTLAATDGLTATIGGDARNAGTLQGGDVTLSAATLDNGGTLTATSGATSLVLAGALANRGELSAHGDLTLTGITGLNNSGKLAALGTLTLAGAGGGALDGVTNTADGVVNGARGLAFAAASLSNAGQLGSADGDVSLLLTGNLDNTGLLYAGGSADYALGGTFTNTNADVVAEQDLSIAGLSGNRAAGIVNTSGLIEATSGNMVLKADAISNARLGSAAVVTETDDPIVTADGNVTTTVTTSREKADPAGAAGQILSGAKLDIDAGSLANSYGLISAAGDLKIRADTVLNEGRDLVEITVTDIATLNSQRYCKHKVFGHCTSHGTRTWTTHDESTATRTYSSLFGTIEAGGLLDANVTGYLNNNAVRGGVGQTGLSSGRPATSLAASAPSAGATPSASVPLDRLAVSIDALSGRGATFGAAASPDMPYLIETRSQFIDPSKYLGSDYFLSRLSGYQPEATLKRLGDSYFEYRLVENQIFDATGKRSLGASLDPQEMMRALYDNALAAQSALNLAPGVALSADQVAKLTTDIVWMEKTTVNGREALVPRLYLAKATAENVNLASAEIRGGSVTVAAADVRNSGAVSSSSRLAMGATNSLLNDGGSLFAGGDLIINAGGAFTNRSGTVSGDNVTIKAASIANATAAQRDLYANGFADRAQQTARIEAKGGLLLDAAGAVTSTGGQFASGGAMTVTAGAGIDIGALRLETSRNDAIRGGYDRAATATNTLASLAAGGNLALSAGNDLTLTGVTATAGGTASLKAGGDVSIASVEDRASQDLKLNIKSGGLFGTKVNIDRSSETSTVRSSSVTAGGGLSIEAGRDATVSASNLTAGTAGPADLTVTAGRDVVVASAIDTAGRSSGMADKGFLSASAKTSSSYDETTVGSELKASGNIALKAGEAAAISGSSLDAGKAIDVTGASVSVIGAEETHAASSSQKKSGLFVGSGGGFVSLYGSKATTNTGTSIDNVGSTLKAGTDVTLKATGTDIGIIGSQVEAGNDLKLIAARDVNVTPGAEASSSSSETKRSGFGLSFSAGNGSLSVGIGVKKTDDRTQQSADTNAVSVLKAGRDLTIDAGRDANLQATNASAGRDLAVTAGRDVNLLAAADQTDYARLHSEMFAGVTLSVSSKLIGAGEKLVDAAGKLGGDNGAYAAAPAALAIYQGYKAVTPTAPADGVGQATGGLDLSKINGLTDWQGMQASGLGSVSLSVGASSQKSKTTVSSSTPVVTSLVSGGSTAISAEEGSITGTGAQIAAGFNANGQPVATADASAGNVLLSAAKDISLSSAQSTSRTDSSSTSKSASVGMDLASGSISANAAYSTGKTAATSSQELDSHVTGTGTVALNSGNDTSLKGAVVTGGTVIANVGGDLAIESQQDASRYREKSTSMSGGISSSGVTVGASRSTVNGDFANVAEQSGIVAGAGGYHVAVGGAVDLKAGVIASSADKSNNALSADHLTYSNLDNVSNASSSGFGLSVGIGFDGKVSAPTPSVSQPAKEEDSGRALATLTPGALTLDNQKQDLSGLNTDLGKANTTVTPYDIDRLKAKQESAAALSELLNGLAGDLSNQLHFAEGSPEKIALHTAVGAIVAKLAGGDIAAGAVAGAASEIANGVLQEVLKANPNLSDPDRKAITQWVAVMVGAAVGGQTGAATAIDNVNFNYLTHEQLDKAKVAAARLAACTSAGGNCTPEQIASLTQEVIGFQNKSAENTAKLIAECSGDTLTASCRQQISDLIDFANAIDKDNSFGKYLGDGAGVFSVKQSVFDYDHILADHYKGVLDGSVSPAAAQKAAIADITSKEGTINGLASALGVVGGFAVCGSGAGTAACIAGLIAAAGSGNHLYGNVQQAISGEEAKSALVQALVKKGMSQEEAEKYQAYVDAGVIFVTAGEGIYSFAINAKRAGAAAEALKKLDGETFVPPQTASGGGVPLVVPGRVQSRINLANGSSRYTPLNEAGNPVAAGWDHVVSRHFGGTNSQSQFTLSQTDIRGILQSRPVVSAPVSEVKMINGTPTYVRTVDVGQVVGTVRQSQGGLPTSRITIQTDMAGNLITAYPVP
ncbi:hemagglutinin repeat-containing protein [Pleomorphomonas oryzae]|uniref:hemagglutinin repeat-containing protein n=1 Tax=Pleomorphomonas oryzae TaxID=261934 RepID=UPI000410BACF|nr:hemagglutinin repeat-containing protein [Pleomorphomonas oryzae]